MSADKSPAAASPKGGDLRIKAGSSWANAWKIAAAIGGIGLVATAGLGFGDLHRFAYSYLFAAFVFLTIGLGSLFFVVIQFLTKAWWSVSIRRTAEFFMMGLPAVVVLMLPLLAPPVMGELFPWIADGAAAKRASAEATHAGAPSHGAPAPLGPPGQKHEAAPPANQAEHSMLDVPATDDDEQPSRPLRGATAQAGPAPTPRPVGGAAPPTHMVSPGQIAPHGPPGGGHFPPPHGMPGAGGHTPGHDPYAASVEKAAEQEEEKVLESKRAYLNQPFFYVREVLFGIIWVLLAMTYFKWSTGQDASKDMKVTARAQQRAPIALFFFGLSLTFAAFDWLMSLNPMWYSTIFGVTIFAGSVVSALAVLVLTVLGLRNSGLFGNTVTVEHLHDLGKLLFGFLVFWAYVTFSQFFLIWYSAIPEELTFFHTRWDLHDGSWKPVVYLILCGHFVVPFWLLMSRNIKRRPFYLGIGAFIILLMHVVELYWIVLPNIGGFEFNVLDLTSLLGVGGAYLAVVFYVMQKHPLIPVGDPRLGRALKFENA